MKRKVRLPAIHNVRGHIVVLDADVAALYGVPTKRLNEAVQRNVRRFPADFCFHVTVEEFTALRSQIATLDNSSPGSVRSAAGKHPGRGQHRKYLPRVFTEHGALMAATILRSRRAVEMSLYLVRAFVKLRETVLANTNILKRLAEIDGRLLEHDSVLRQVVEKLLPLLSAATTADDAKPKIGFHQGNR